MEYFKESDFVKEFELEEDDLEVTPVPFHPKNPPIHIHNLTTGESFSTHNYRFVEEHPELDLVIDDREPN